MGAALKIEKTTQGKVVAKVNLGTNSGSYSYRSGTKRSIKANEAEDRKAYPFVVAYPALDSFLSANGISDKDIAVDPESIDKFYGYENYNGGFSFSANLSKSFVDSWWNCDCPTLYRFAPNRDGSENWIGLKFSCFQNLLCEASLSYTSVGDDITEEEVAALAKGREHTGIYDEMRKRLASRQLTKENIKELEEWVAEYEAMIQGAIDQNADAILGAVKGRENESFGFDCGWLNIYAGSPEYKEKKGLLKNAKGGGTSDWLSVNLPFWTQSTTLQRMMFEKAREIIKDQTGEELYCNAVLD